jgi:hypothetical protein
MLKSSLHFGRPSQEEGYLPEKKTEFLDHEPEGHDADTCSDPGKERPLVRHVNAAIADFYSFFIFVYFRHYS